MMKPAERNIARDDCLARNRSGKIAEKNDLV